MYYKEYREYSAIIKIDRLKTFNNKMEFFTARRSGVKCKVFISNVIDEK